MLEPTQATTVKILRGILKKIHARNCGCVNQEMLDEFEADIASGDVGRIQIAIGRAERWRDSCAQKHDGDKA